MQIYLFDFPGTIDIRAIWILIRIGSGTAVTNKHTGDRLSLSIRWNESAENEETAP